MAKLVSLTLHSRRLREIGEIAGHWVRSILKGASVAELGIASELSDVAVRRTYREPVQACKRHPIVQGSSLYDALYLWTQIVLSPSPIDRHFRVVISFGEVWAVYTLTEALPKLGFDATEHHVLGVLGLIELVLRTKEPAPIAFGHAVSVPNSVIVQGICCRYCGVCNNRLHP